jgi:hypothetical protein
MGRAIFLPPIQGHGSCNRVNFTFTLLYTTLYSLSLSVSLKYESKEIGHFRVDRRPKKCESITGLVWVAGFHSDTARYRLACVLKFMTHLFL